MTVDLPDPFGPRKPKIEPLAMENETRSTAVNWPKRLVNASHWIMVSAGIFKMQLVSSPVVGTIFNPHQGSGC